MRTQRFAWSSPVMAIVMVIIAMVMIHIRWAQGLGPISPDLRKRRGCIPSGDVAQGGNRTLRVESKRYGGKVEGQRAKGENKKARGDTYN